MTVDDDKLRRLDKASLQRADTGPSREPWQEPLGRYTSIPATKVSQAAAVIQGMSGSWMAFYAQDLASRDQGNSLGGPALQTKVSHLGQPGMPEINFAPYSHRTNRFASKGPSLLGHPISFSIVGPTMKAFALEIQWEITDNTGLAGGDLLTISSRGIRSPAGGPAVAPDTATISRVYDSLDLADFPGGLYLTITATGELGDLEGSPGGLGDSWIFDDGGLLAPISAINPNSKSEIFRIVSIGADFFELDPTKRLATYFTFTGGAIPACRAVMVFEPHAARMVMVPDSGVTASGANLSGRVFAVVSPETSANSDFMPPYDGTTLLGGTWVQGGFDLSDRNNFPNGAGHLASYGGRTSLPVPIPLAEKSGRTQDLSGVPVYPGVGRMNILVDLADADANDVGKILRVHSVKKKGTSELTALPGGKADESALFGWFEVDAVDVPSGRYTLRRVTEVDPTTGKLSYGLPDALILDNLAAPTDRWFLGFTLHNTISSMHLDNVLDMDKLEASRLTNLIDPSWVERSTKTEVRGSSAARADRSIFDTASSGAGAAGTNANPGSMLDLGFRMVLYPAKAGSVGTTVTPDWDNPIDSLEVTLDPNITDEKQFLSVDYSSGLVTLSHDPVPGPGCTLAPNGLIHGGEPTVNPRGEVILFAACVPFSMEEGQTGTGNRILGGDGRTNDVYSERIYVPVDSRVDGTPALVESGSNLTLDLAIQEGGDPFPPTGFFDLVQSTTEGTPFFTTGSGKRACTFGYQGKETVVDSETGISHIRLLAVHGGALPGASGVPGNYDGRTLAVLRRDVYGPNSSDGAAGTDYQHDTSYGFASRPSSVQIEGADLTSQAGGSLKVNLRRLSESTGLFDSLASNWLLSGGVVTSGSGPNVSVSGAVVLAQGRRSTTSTADVRVVDVPYNYIFVDVSDPEFPKVRNLPFASLTGDPNLVLLARVESVAGSVTSIQDLRKPLSNLDLKLEVLVGKQDGPPQQVISHFDTLKEAIDYVGEIAHPKYLNSFDGTNFLIKIVGYTDETSTILLPLDGLTIEGAYTRTSGVSLSSASIVNPGSGYVVGETLIPVPKDAVTGFALDTLQRATLRVSSVGAGGTITGIQVEERGIFPPTLDLTSVGSKILVGGFGSGATFDLGTSPVRQGVRFDFETGSLIDLNSKRNWTFRNVSFEYIDNGQPANTNPGDRVLFSGSGEKMEFEGVHFAGNRKAHGFYYSDGVPVAPMAVAGLAQSTFRACRVRGVTDFGIHLEDAALVWFSLCLVESCTFEDLGFAPETLSADSQNGIRLPQSDFSQSTNIRNCTFSGFSNSIKCSASNVLIEGCLLFLSNMEAIKVTPFYFGFRNPASNRAPLENVRIENNILDSLWRKPPGLISRSGILVDTEINNPSSNVHIRGNRVTLLGVHENRDADIRVNGFECIVENNYCETSGIHLEPGVYATGSVTVAILPTALDTLTLANLSGSVVLTAVAGAPASDEFTIGVDLSTTASNLAAALISNSNSAALKTLITAAVGSVNNVVDLRASPTGERGNYVLVAASNPTSLVVADNQLIGGVQSHAHSNIVRGNTIAIGGILSESLNTLLEGNQVNGLERITLGSGTPGTRGIISRGSLTQILNNKVLNGIQLVGFSTFEIRQSIVSYNVSGNPPIEVTGEDTVVEMDGVSAGPYGPSLMVLPPRRLLPSPGYIIKPGTVHFTEPGGAIIASDDSAGGFLPPASGSFNYTTGLTTLTFGAVPAAGTLRVSYSLEGTSGPIDLVGPGNVVKGNQIFGDITLTGGDNILEGNQVEGVIDASAPGTGQSRISGNTLTLNSPGNAILLSGSGGSVCENRIAQGSVVLSGSSSLISGNHLTLGSLSLGLGVGNVASNNILQQGFITCPGGSGIIAGNSIQTSAGNSILAAGPNVQITGNHCQRDITSNGGDALISANHVGTDFSSGGPANISCTQPRASVTNNIVEGNILIGTSGFAPSVSQNRVTGDISLSTGVSSYVCMGNRVNAFVNPIGVAPNDPAVNGILVGNIIVDNATGQFGAAITGGTGAKDNNV